LPRFVLLSVLAALFAVGAVWLVRAPGQAEAHAVLVRADPAVNADLRVPPDIVTAFFSEALDDRLSSIEAVDGTGESVDTGDVTFGPEPERMSVGVEDDLAPGFYTVIWESLSSVDGHLFKGSYPFAVLNEDGSQPSGPKFEAGGGGSESSDPEDIAVKWAQLLSATALVGSLAFVLWVSMPVARRMEAPWVESTREAVRKRLRWVAIPAAGALALVAGAELLLQAGQLGGFEFIGDVLRNDWGQRICCARPC